MGIIAGGQLGKMLIQEASRWDIVTYVLDPDEACSARNVASFYVKGDFRDFDAVYAFGKQVDILTFELEDVNIPALQ
ncbi:MAG: 5-(carboxyamino)imidazole ribonucleotide synthase, partial [Sulfurovum sp. 28-43-6]